MGHSSLFLPFKPPDLPKVLARLFTPERRMAGFAGLKPVYKGVLSLSDPSWYDYSWLFLGFLVRTVPSLGLFPRVLAGLTER